VLLGDMRHFMDEDLRQIAGSVCCPPWPCRFLPNPVGINIYPTASSHRHIAAFQDLKNNVELAGGPETIICQHGANFRVELVADLPG